MARILTPADRTNAERLLAIWTRRKDGLKLTQTSAAQALGFANQGVVSQYLNCHIALNTDVILKFAKLLGVSPGEIAPSLATLSIAGGAMRLVRIPILAKLSGQKPGSLETVEIMTRMDRKIYAVAVDTDGFEPFYDQGSTLIVSQNEDPITGDKVFIRHTRGDHSVHIIKVYVLTDHVAKTVVLRDLGGDENFTLPLAEIDACDPIVGVEAPVIKRPIRLHPSKLIAG
jgi:hypothetical protein